MAKLMQLGGNWCKMETVKREKDEFFP